MKKIVDYTYSIGKETLDYSFSKATKEMMKDGWRPFGGIVAAFDPKGMGTIMLCQAMVKYEEEE